MINALSLVFSCAAFSISTQRIRLKVGYSLAAIIALKTSIDGGLLSYSFLLSLSVFIGLNMYYVSKRKYSGYCYIALLVLNLIYFFAWLTVTGFMPGKMLISYLFLCAIFSVLLWRFTFSHGRAVAWLVYFWMSMVLTIGVMSGVASLLIPLPKNTMAIVKIQDHYQISSVAGKMPLHVYLYYHEDPLKPERTFISQPMDAGDEIRHRQFLLLPLDINENVDRQVKQKIYKIHAQGVANKFFINVDIIDPLLPSFFGSHSGKIQNNNYWVHLHTLANYYRASGISEFVIQPLHSDFPK